MDNKFPELKKIESMKLINNVTNENYMVLPDPMVADKINELVDAVNYILKELQKEQTNHVIVTGKKI